MDSFGIVVSWFVATFFGFWTGLGVAQAVTGRFLFRIFNPPRVEWSTNEIKVSGLSYAICGIVGAASILIVGLFGAFGVGTPWIMVSNPFMWAFFATLLAQGLIEQHHRGKWPFKRSSPSI
jgi:hypothetical protein